LTFIFSNALTTTYGHESGDRILAQLAEILNQQVRAGDFAFRMGGEEFLIVLADVNQEVIQRVAEKFRSIVANFAFKLDNQKVLSITVSIGTAIHDGHPDFNDTIKLADGALYIAKEMGRNKVVAADQSPTTYGML